MLSPVVKVRGMRRHCITPRDLNVMRSSTLSFPEYALKTAHSCCSYNNHSSAKTTRTTTVLRPFVRDYPGEPVPEETFTHPPSWSSSSLYQLLPSTTIHSILLVQITCLEVFLHNLFPCPLWFTSWSGALHLLFHTFLHPISVFFSQHMPHCANPGGEECGLWCVQVCAWLKGEGGLSRHEQLCQVFIVRAF